VRRKKRSKQVLLILIFFALNFTICFDLDFYHIMQEEITDRYELKFIRLVAVVFLALYGTLFETLSDLQSKCLYGLFLGIYFAGKMIYEVQAVSNPLDRDPAHFFGQFDVAVIGFFFTSRIIINYTQYVVISKWTSRTWFPVVIVLVILGESATVLFKEFLQCDYEDLKKLDVDSKEYDDILQCLERESVVGISVSAFVIPCVIAVFYFVKFDPLDEGLIINE